MKIPRWPARQPCLDSMIRHSSTTRGSYSRSRSTCLPSKTQIEGGNGCRYWSHTFIQIQLVSCTKKLFVYWVIGFVIAVLSLLQARDMISSECDQVKEICDTLASFKSNPRPSAYNSYDNQEIGSPFGDYARNDYSRHEEPTRDPDVWPPPTPVEHR